MLSAQIRLSAVRLFCRIMQNILYFVGWEQPMFVSCLFSERTFLHFQFIYMSICQNRVIKSCEILMFVCIEKDAI